MWLLHTGVPHDARSVPARASRPERRRDPGCPERQSVPVHRLPEHRESSPACGQEDAGGSDRMKLVDLTHKFSIHTPGWVGYPSPKLSYFQRHATNGIVSQWLETPLHAGTHFDGEMHIVSGGKDIASVPLTTLCREGVIVDLSDEME